MQRRIKSFVLRNGRVSPRQQLGLETYLPKYLLSNTGEFWDLAALFNREAETIFEIGFGMGQSLLQTALMQPEINFIGVEVHKPGAGSLAADLYAHQIDNVRIVTEDAVDILQYCIAPHALAGIQIFFPDPWPKKRHHKRRLVQPSLIHLAASRLKSGGFIHCATDWEEYAQYMLTVLNQEPTLNNQQSQGGYIPRPLSRPLTKFEQRGHRLGHGIWDLMYYRTAINL